MASVELKSEGLPSFFVVGPPRTGTTWLHEILKPHASLPEHVKETRFFDQNFRRGIDWYLRYFSPEAIGPRGEVAPTYFASPAACGRIARLTPAAKVVCIFRHPVERALSLYRLKRAYGMLRGNIHEALLRDREIVESGKYATHLKTWQKAFGRDHVLTAFYEELRDQPQTFVNRLADFIGIPRFGLADTQIGMVHGSQTYTHPRLRISTRVAVAFANQMKGRHLDRVVAALKNSRAGKLFLSGGKPFARVSPEVGNRVVRAFRSEIEELEAMLDVDLSAWKSGALYDPELSEENIDSEEAESTGLHDLRKHELPDGAA
jgi:hypothetical protein